MFDLAELHNTMLRQQAENALTGELLGQAAAIPTQQPLHRYPKELSWENIHNGWVVTVGCKKLYFKDKKELVEAFSLYLDNPQRAEEKYVPREDK